MKKRLTYIVSVIVLAGFTACSDYLDIKPRGYDVPSKLAHYEGLLYGRESGFMPVYYYMTFEHTVDEDGYLNIYGIPYGYNFASAYIWKDAIFRDDDACSEWNEPCSELYTVNVIIDEVMEAEDGTHEEKQAVLAEARFKRAWFTFMMSQWFGKPYNAATAATDPCVPIITKASTVGEDYPRKSVKDTYQWVITEMTESLPLLPEKGSHVVRIFNATGNAMLGRVYWMMGNYGDALPYLDTAKKSLDAQGGKGLVNLGELIDEEEGMIFGYPSMTYSPETVYEIQYMANLWTFLGPMMGTPHRTLRVDVMQWLFDTDDYRLAFFDGYESWLTAYADFDPADRYYTNGTSTLGNDGISVQDVYLMYAECLAREGRLTDARQVLYELRRNRMPEASAEVPSSVSSQDDLIRFCVEERFREHFGIGNNWYDMRRLWHDPLFQYLKQYYTRTDGTNTHTLTEARLTMQIPPSVMRWHPEYQQND